MKLNHLNLTVTDVPKARQFLKTYFEMQGGGENDHFAFLTDDAGMFLTLASDRENEVRYPRSFHIGFLQESEERVNEINERLKRDGFDVPPPSKLHGSWTFYMVAPGGFTVEVLADSRVNHHFDSNGKEAKPS